MLKLISSLHIGGSAMTVAYRRYLVFEFTIVLVIDDVASEMFLTLQLRTVQMIGNVSISVPALMGLDYR